MNHNSLPRDLPATDFTDWDTQGYIIVRGLWKPDEVADCRERFNQLSNEPSVRGHWEPDFDSDQPLRRFPRVLHPHRFDALSQRMLLDSRVQSVLQKLMGEEPIATQSMFYFKPPGGKGQALHQDNFYLRVRPKTCVAAWTAIDPATPRNGGLYVCPGTHTMDLQCPELASPEESFTTHFVRPPGGIVPVPAELEPGDVLFFNGSVVHGSRPNTTKDQWRRSFICHYAPASAQQIYDWYFPCLRFDGTIYEGYTHSTEGSPCGTEFPADWPPSEWGQANAAGLQPVRHGSIPG